MSRASARSSRSATPLRRSSATRSMPSRSRLDVAPDQAGEHVDDGAPAGSGRADRQHRSRSARACRRRRRRRSRGADRRGRSRTATPARASGAAAARPSARRSIVRRFELIGVGDREAFEALLDDAAAACTVRRYTFGIRTGAAQSAAISTIASTSRRKSSSARKLLANCPSISPDRRPWPNGVRRCADAREERQRREVALDHRPGCPGRCTFTTTASPVAAARGTSGRWTRRRAAPSRTRRRPPPPRRRARPPTPAGSDRSARPRPGSGGRPARRTSRGHEVDAGRGDLAELDVHAAGFLEHAPEAHADGSAERSARPPADEIGPNPSRRASRTSSRYRRSTETIRDAQPASGRGAVTSPARSPIASEPGRASRSSATAAAIVAGMPIASIWTDEPVGAPVPVVQARGRANAAPPQPRTPDEQGGPPAAPDAEQPQRDDVVTTASADAAHDAERPRNGRSTNAIITAAARHDPPGQGRPRRTTGVRCGREPRPPARPGAGTRARRRRRTGATRLPSPSNAKSVGDAAAREQVGSAWLAARGGSCSGRSKRRMPGSSLGTSLAPSTAQSSAGSRRHRRRRAAGRGRSRARTCLVRVRSARHPASQPAGSDATHGTEIAGGTACAMRIITLLVPQSAAPAIARRCTRAPAASPPRARRHDANDEREA